MAEETEQIQDDNLNRRARTKTGFYYSFLTVVLLFCLIQIGYGAILNITKTIAYQAKISTLTKIKNTAEERNQDLKVTIKYFPSMPNLEGIARNNLKMAGEDEVLILINQAQPTAPKPDKKNKKQNKKK